MADPFDVLKSKEALELAEFIQEVKKYFLLDESGQFVITDKGRIPIARVFDFFKTQQGGDYFLSVEAAWSAGDRLPDLPITPKPTGIEGAIGDYFGRIGRDKSRSILESFGVSDPRFLDDEIQRQLLGSVKYAFDQQEQERILKLNVEGVYDYQRQARYSGADQTDGALTNAIRQAKALGIETDWAERTLGEYGQASEIQLAAHGMLQTQVRNMQARDKLGRSRLAAQESPEAFKEFTRLHGTAQEQGVPSVITSAVSDPILQMLQKSRTPQQLASEIRAGGEAAIVGDLGAPRDPYAGFFDWFNKQEGYKAERDKILRQRYESHPDLATAYEKDISGALEAGGFIPWVQKDARRQVVFQGGESRRAQRRTTAMAAKSPRTRWLNY